MRVLGCAVVVALSSSACNSTAHKAQASACSEAKEAYRQFVAQADDAQQRLDAAVGDTSGVVITAEDQVLRDALMEQYGLQARVIVNNPSCFNPADVARAQEFLIRYR